MFPIGKGAALSKFQKFLSFLNKDASKAEVKGAAERLLPSFDDDKVGHPFDQTCVSQFHQKTPQIERWCSQTSDAATFHSYRVYYEVQCCNGRNCLKCKYWRQKEKNGKLFSL